MDLGPDLAQVDAAFADGSAAYAVQATLCQLQYTTTVYPGLKDLPSQILFGGEMEGHDVEHWTYTARLLGAGGQILSACHIDDRPRRHRDVGVLLARFLAHAFARGLPAALIGKDAVIDAWDPRWPLGIPEHALQPAWAHDVLRAHGWRADTSAGTTILSTGWEPRARDGILGAVGKAGNLVLGALGGDPIANLREAKTTFFAEPRGVRVVQERNGIVARDLVVERARISTFAVLHHVDAPSPQPAQLLAIDATTGPCPLAFMHRAGPCAMPQAVYALRSALACALLGR